MYVDYLEFDGTATNEASYNFSKLQINPNMVVYFAQAFMNGNSVAEKIDQASLLNGRNGGVVSNGVVLIPGRLRWVSTYTGHFSSTNIVSGGVTNAVNAALVQSADIDSNGNGIANANDPSPFSFASSQLNFTETLTNVPPLSIQLSWYTPHPANDYVYYATNLISTNWTLLLQTNISLYQSSVSVLDPVNLTQPRFYRVQVQPLQ